ncbi:MAG: hypothetical protein LCH61_15825 [Proteobacteria bacterium]|nr:hypothetical protein [Pseudomonadota bacterium]
MIAKSRHFSISLVVPLMVRATIGLVAGAVHLVWVKATNANSTLVAADLNAQIAGPAQLHGTW